MIVDSQRSIFNLFHDGSITEIKKTETGFLLKIEILYLAEMLSKEFEYYFIELVNCSSLSFFNWENDKLISSLAEISEMEPEILRCSKQDIQDLVVVCNTLIGPGGLLKIKTDDVKIYDQINTPISYEQLDSISDRYWNSLGHKQ